MNMFSLFRLKSIAKKKFGVSSKILLKTLESSHGADGYILGAIGEMKFKEYAESKGYEVLRIKEKPEGAFDSKTDDAKGDFYIRKKDSNKDEGYVVECKSVKSNAEARSVFATKSGCKKALKQYSVNRSAQITSLYNSGLNDYNNAKSSWPMPAAPGATMFDDLESMISALEENGVTVFPPRMSAKDKKTIKYPQVFKIAQDNGYNYGISFPAFGWSTVNPGPCVPDLSGVFGSEEEVDEWLDKFSDDDFTKEAFWDLRAPVRLLQTHMPPTRKDKIGIESTGPLRTEFSILCLDLFIRTNVHELVFVNSQELNPQAVSPNHLQQNYTVDVLVKKDGYKRHPLIRPWYDDLDQCIRETRPSLRKIDLTQIDNRK